MKVCISNIALCRLFGMLVFIILAAAHESHGESIENSKASNNAINSNSLTGNSDDSDVVTVLIKTITLIPVTNGSADEIGLPFVELEKLKTAAKNAGLPDAKAERVVRAVRALDMKYNQVVDLRKVLSNPATSADYAERVRRALEDAVIEKQQAIYASEAFDDPKNPFSRSVNEKQINSDNKIQPQKSVSPTTASNVLNTLPQIPGVSGFGWGIGPGIPLVPISASIPSTGQTFFGTPLDAPALPDDLERLWFLATHIMGRKEAFEFVQVVHKLAITRAEVFDLQHQFASGTIAKEKAMALLKEFNSRLTNESQTSKVKPTAGKATESSDLSKPLDVPSLNRLKIAAELSGLNETTSNRLVRAVKDLGLNATHIEKIGDVIQNDAATPDDLDKFIEHLEETNSKSQARSSGDGFKEDEFVSTPDQAEGADWIFEPADQNQIVQQNLGSNQARALNLNGENEIVQEQLFTAKRFCGFSPKVDASRLSNCAPGQYPWSAAILSPDNRFLCSGTLISESIVLTTASCVLRYRTNSRNNQPLKVVVGAWSLPEGYEYLPERQIYVSAAVLHPNYKHEFNSPVDVQNNIALLRLVENIDFDSHPHVFPICLIGHGLERNAESNQCQVLGWPDLPEIENWRTRAYLSSGEVHLVKEGCTSHPQSGPCVQGQACVGNEGSVVQCLADSNRYYLWGIIASEPNCERGSSVTLSIVNIIKHYEFISKYLWSPNPNSVSNQNRL